VLEPGPDDLKKITWLACKAGSDYDCIVFDPPSGSHPLSLLAAGMCERTLLLARHDTISIAASHRLLDTLDSDGLSQRVGIVFAMVESPGQAASLKARFDAATYNFLGIRVGDTGFIPRLEPALVGNLSIDKPVEDAGELITHLKMDHIAPFHDATKFGASIAGFRVSTKVRR
jgi:MinD-like ATPase involved in chromosome partitioning or flagellar assembly